LELGPHRRIIDDVLDLLCTQRTRLLQNVFEQARAHAHIVGVSGHVQQHEGEGLLHARQRPEGDATDGTLSFLFGDEAPLRAHRACGEHALQVLLYFSTVAGGSPDEEVELVGT